MTPGAPTVYFIDDSATMREVIKIAFRRENINVIACHDGASALAQMEELKPDVVISDVIMPDKDGYQVCEHIKQHPQLGKTPVILMSGVVNRAVAERAFIVKADELIRKPFQPQDLLGRVQHLLRPRTAAAAPPAAAISANTALSSIFATPPANQMPMPRISAAASHASAVATAALALEPFPAPQAPFPDAIAASPSPVFETKYEPQVGGEQQPPAPAPSTVPVQPATMGRAGITTLDLQKMKVEVLRLQGLVRKLQVELEAEREYVRSLETHIKTLQDAE